MHSSLTYSLVLVAWHPAYIPHWGRTEEARVQPLTNWKSRMMKGARLDILLENLDTGNYGCSRWGSDLTSFLNDCWKRTRQIFEIGFTCWNQIDDAEQHTWQWNFCKFLHCLLSFSALGVAYEGNPMWAQEVGHPLVKASLSSGMWHTLHIVYHISETIIFKVLKKTIFGPKEAQCT